MGKGGMEWGGRKGGREWERGREAGRECRMPGVVRLQTQKVKADAAERGSGLVVTPGHAVSVVALPLTRWLLSLALLLSLSLPLSITSNDQSFMVFLALVVGQTSMGTVS